MKLLFIVLVCFTTVKSIAQSDDNSPSAVCPSSAQCSRNLILPIPMLKSPDSIKEFDESYAINPNDPTTMPSGFHDVSFQGPAGCGLPNECSEDGSVLRYHVYYPTQNVVNYSSTCKLPVVVYFHGGSFADCNGSYVSADLSKFCIEFAQRGFILISVEYRKGVILESNNSYYTVQQILAIWRACQDARGAIRSMVRREIEGNEPYRIDLNNIFIAGNSAGSVIAMNVAYYGLTSMLISAFPSGTSLSSNKVLGNINQNYYYGGDGSSSTGGYNYAIKGVLDLWGGVLVPKNTASVNYVTRPDLFFFQTGNTPPPPTIAFCGQNDLTFIPDKKQLKFSATGSESFCLNDSTGNTSFTITPQTPNNGNILGSQTIYNMLHTKHVLTEFYLDCQMGHGLDDDCIVCSMAYPRKKDNTGACLMCTFASEFGTSLTTQDAVNLYIVQRAATFFQAVMKANIYSDFTTTKFVECENKRYSICNSTADNNNSCPTDINSTNQVCTSQP